MTYLLYFVSTFFLVNGIPHYIQGVCGSRFQSPFADPPGKGESSPLINVLWGLFNFLVGYLLLRYAGFFEVGLNIESYVFFSGVLVFSMVLAIAFDRIRNST